MERISRVLSCFGWLILNSSFQSKYFMEKQLLENNLVGSRIATLTSNDLEISGYLSKYWTGNPRTP